MFFGLEFKCWDFFVFKFSNFLGLIENFSVSTLSGRRTNVQRNSNHEIEPLQRNSNHEIEPLMKFLL